MGCFRVTVLQSGCPGGSVAIRLLLAVALVTPLPIRPRPLRARLRILPIGLRRIPPAWKDRCEIRPAARLPERPCIYRSDTAPTPCPPIPTRAGSYRFSGLGEGIYMLRVEMAGYEPGHDRPLRNWTERSEET